MNKELTIDNLYTKYLNDLNQSEKNYCPICLNIMMMMKIIIWNYQKLKQLRNKKKNIF